jgi:hypothetical protein
MISTHVDMSQFSQLANAFAAAGAQSVVARRRAVNHVGMKAKTQMIRALVRQTGLERGIIVRAMRVASAASSSASYVMTTRGGNIRLKYFSPKETRAGVTANPHGKRQLYPGTFMKGGRFPNRKSFTKTLKAGNVYERHGKKRFPVGQATSGVYIPVEMLQGDSMTAFYQVTQRELLPRLSHELARVLGA